MAEHPITEAGHKVQRVRVGMTGLAVIVLFIALASAVFRSASTEPALTGTGAPKTAEMANAATDNVADAAKEPLAEIGVTPSAAADPDPSANSAAAAAPAR
ncbi:MAG: hypothetical protein ACKVOB_09575 [Sphingomonas sp.]